MAAAEKIAPAPDAPSDWSHLDHWRIKPLGDEGLWAFGPVHLPLKLAPGVSAFLRDIAPSPRHGMLWSDAEALGHMRAQVSKEAQTVARRVNSPFRRAVLARSGREKMTIGQLIRVCPMHGRGTPMCFVVKDGRCWMEAFRAAIIGGITEPEVERLNTITGKSFTQVELAMPPRFRRVESYPNDIGFAWDGIAQDHPLFVAMKALANANNDDPYFWGRDIQITFGWGWLSRPKNPPLREATAEQLRARLVEVEGGAP